MIILGIDPGTASTGYAVLSFEKGKKPVLKSVMFLFLEEIQAAM